MLIWDCVACKVYKMLYFQRGEYRNRHFLLCVDFLIGRPVNMSEEPAISIFNNNHEDEGKRFFKNIDSYLQNSVIFQPNPKYHMIL
jgi:hypothetical protein